MGSRKKHSHFFWFMCLLVGFIISGCANTQVTNNSGSLLNRAKVGQVGFSENLDYCGTGCSTGFKRVRTGNNTISLRETVESSWISIGNLGPFVRDKFYSVNIRKAEQRFCAELWKRTDTTSEFNNDTTKELIQSLCPKEPPPPDGGPVPISQVTNNSGTLLDIVKVGAVEFSQNLDYCATGCSTGFEVVAAGDNQIAIKRVSSPGWNIMNQLLGPFEYGSMYSVNITKNVSGSYCAELWRRYDTGGEFNNDTTKEFIEAHCFE